MNPSPVLNTATIDDHITSLHLLQTMVGVYCERREFEVGPGEPPDLDYSYDVESDIRALVRDLYKLREVLR